MLDLDEMIRSSREALEVKRALSVKLFLGSMPVVEICELLRVSQPFVSKWHGIYASQGIEGLELGYEGGASYLSEEQRTEVLAWIGSQESLEVAGVRDYLEERHGIVYQSRQSYYELMRAAGLSYHKSEKRNPKRDEELVQERREEIKKTGVSPAGNRVWRDDCFVSGRVSSVVG